MALLMQATAAAPPGAIWQREGRAQGERCLKLSFLWPFHCVSLLASLLTFIYLCSTAKKQTGKSKEEAQKEKKQELEKRLQDVSGQLGGQFNKKNAKKGELLSISDLDGFKLQANVYMWSDSKVKSLLMIWTSLIVTKQSWIFYRSVVSNRLIVNVNFSDDIMRVNWAIASPLVLALLGSSFLVEAQCFGNKL